MIGWIILGVILALLLLILLIPVGVDLGYEEGRFHLSAKVSALLIQLFPRKEKKPKEPKKKKKKKKAPKPAEEEAEPKPRKKRSLPFDRDELLDLLRTVLRGLGKFGRAWHVDRFVLHYVAAGRDPYDVAMTYGWVNAALSSLAPLCRQRFHVRDCSVWTDVDFVGSEGLLDLGLAMTINLWRIFGVINSIAFGALKILLRSKRRRKREARALKKAQKNAPPAPEGEALPEGGQALPEQENTNKENIQEEERMAANG